MAAIKASAQTKMARALGDAAASVEYTDAIDLNTAKLMGTETIPTIDVTSATITTLEVTDTTIAAGGTFLPATDNDVDLGSATKEFKNGYFDGILEADQFFNEDLVLNSTNEININITGVGLLAIDNAAIANNVAAEDSAAFDCFIETQDGGPATTGVAGQDGGSFSLKLGDASMGFNTEDQNGGAGPSFTMTAGTGARAGLISGGTANGGKGGGFDFVCAAGGDGGDASGNDGDGGSFEVTTGAAGTGGGGTTGVAGVIRLAGVRANKQATPGTVTNAVTFTVAQMLGGIITGTQSSGSTNAVTLPTGTAIDAALPSTFVVDDSFDITFINLSAALVDTYTLTANTGSGDFTIVGNPIIESAHNDSEWSSSATFRCRKTASNTFVAYRIS